MILLGLEKDPPSVDVSKPGPDNRMLSELPARLRLYRTALAAWSKLLMLA